MTNHNKAVVGQSANHGITLRPTAILVADVGGCQDAQNGQFTIQISV